MLIFAPNGENEVFLLRDHSSAWTASSNFPRHCPIDASAVFVGTADGLICYGSGNGKTCELNYVVCNPVTGEYLRLPTLHAGKQYREISTQRVTMVMRHGWLHQLWVEAVVSVTFVYDCVISKAAMERRIANSGKIIIPLPNNWMEFYFSIRAWRSLVYMEPNIIAPAEEEDFVVDVDDFSVAECIHERPIEWQDSWYVDKLNMFVCDGKLLTSYYNNRAHQDLRICLVTFGHSESGHFSRHQPLFDVRSHSVRMLLGCSLGSFFDDKCLLSCGDALGECFAFRNFPGPGPGPGPGSGSGSGSLEIKWVEEDAIKVSKPAMFFYDWNLLELSFLDSPGSLASPDDFNWSMVIFPAGNHEQQELLQESAWWDAETPRLWRDVEVRRVHRNQD